MERHNQVYIEGSFIAIYISLFKMQSVISIILSSPAALFYNVCLQVQPDNFRSNPPDFRKVIVDDKCQVGFSTTEIYDMNGVPFPVGKFILQNLKKAIDLAEFIIHGTNHLSLPGKDPHIHQWCDGFTFLQNILLLSVMFFSNGCRPAFCRHNGFPIGTGSFFGQQNTMFSF